MALSERFLREFSSTTAEQPSAPVIRLDLVGAAEAAELLGIGRAALCERRQRHRNFSAPVAQLRCGPVWFRWQIQTYQAEEQRLGRRGWYGQRPATGTALSCSCQCPACAPSRGCPRPAALIGGPLAAVAHQVEPVCLGLVVLVAAAHVDDVDLAAEHGQDLGDAGELGCSQPVVALLDLNELEAAILPVEEQVWLAAAGQRHQRLGTQIAKPLQPVAGNDLLQLAAAFLSAC